MYGAAVLQKSRRGIDNFGIAQFLYIYRQFNINIWYCSSSGQTWLANNGICMDYHCCCRVHYMLCMRSTMEKICL